MQEEVVVQHDRTGAVADAHGDRVAHRGARQRLRDARRRMDRGVRRRRPAVRAPLRGGRGARRAEGPALRHARRAARAPRRRPTRSWPPGSPGTISPRSRRASSPAASRAPRCARSTTSWRTSTCGRAGDLLPLSSRDGPGVHRARARAEAVAHAGPEPAAAPRLGEHTEAVRAGARGASRPGRASRRSRAPPASRGGRRLRARSRGIRVLDLSQWLAGPVAATILGRVRRRRRSWSSCPCPRRRRAARRARRPFVVTNRNKRSITLDVRAPAGPRGVPRARAGERRHRGELPARHARALGPRARHAARGQPAARRCCAPRDSARPARTPRAPRSTRSGSPSAARRI